ncbi:hypothetical protein Q4574_01455 [Aliiglaciecola sp. 3_MG-2023]|uniref:hypothetical protein n=1 Tax=Aliiglaciecola sp. 3_MG-2023 TaxID=3062644 RepID=UPI0026E48891|nr:hypothetical protein [Aliiglaciecola sp. 3_MG-2023]MDO6691925.1 hypothetical protein [Aliiglaciecola sp. 3_MG-2023]
MNRKLKNVVKRLLGRSGLQYHIDAVSADTVSGWACNTLKPSSPCKVELKQGDKVIAETKAATLREDLVAAGIGNGCHGFSIELNMLPFSAEAREVHLFINGKRVTQTAIQLKSSFTDILGDFAVEVEKRMDAMLSIQTERMEREFNYLKDQLKQSADK